jgi:hypothetical protein
MGENFHPFAVFHKRCQTPTIQNLIIYHRPRWLGKVSRMQEERLPIRMLFGRFAGQLSRSRPSKTYLEYVRDDLQNLAEIHQTYGTFMDRWRTCKDEKEWTNIIKMVVEIHT